MTYETYLQKGNQQEKAFYNMAQKLRKEHPITIMMGSLAWGRHARELTINKPTLRDVVHRVGYLEGCFNILNLWARDHDIIAQRTIIDIWNHVE